MGNQTSLTAIPPAVDVYIIYYWNESNSTEVKAKSSIDYDKLFSTLQSKTGLDPLRLCVERKEGFCKRNSPPGGDAKPIIIVSIKPESGSVWETPYADTIKTIVNEEWSTLYGVESCCVEITVL